MNKEDKMIIEELDKEGINLQEIRLNLIHQGNELVWGYWIYHTIRMARWKRDWNMIVKIVGKEFPKEVKRA